MLYQQAIFKLYSVICEVQHEFWLRIASDAANGRGAQEARGPSETLAIFSHKSLELTTYFNKSKTGNNVFIVSVII